MHFSEEIFRLNTGKNWLITHFSQCQGAKSMDLSPRRSLAYWEAWGEVRFTR